MTLTRTATLSDESTGPSYQDVSWIETTVTREQVLLVPVTNSMMYTTTSASASSSLGSFTTSMSKLPLSSDTASLSHQNSANTETSSTETKEATTSDYSSRLQMGDIKTSNSSQVGIAIGIPIAVFVIFFIALGVWYYFRLRKSKKRLDSNKEAHSKIFSFSPAYVTRLEPGSRSSSDTLAEKPYPVIFSPTNYLKTAKDLEMYQQQNNRKPEFRDHLKRLSRVWPARNKSNEKDQDNPIARPVSMLTPVFLKKFILGKESEERPAKVRPQVLKIPSPHQEGDDITMQEPIDLKKQDSSNQSIYIVIKHYSKNLPDEITIDIGDKCVILQKHSDGWCKIRLVGHNSDDEVTSGGGTGLVPRMCLQKM
ncbi:FUS1 [Candida oxycetoniae]|uniref:FUS1 n=1 Tax=Candida oxycetoniae TaxID=497107 RepID=A0AAI9SUK0_9ASCO|nr:FUS1 [Candida oxycetoniae]KAI3402789.2 FUS1 [Candida oxycetoniae]